MNFSDLEDDSCRSESSGSASLQVNAEPEGKWPEHAVPFTVLAKAVRPHQGKMSEAAAPIKSAHPSVLGRARGSSLSLLDTNGDGRPNLVGIDTNGDGFVDSLAVDTTGDGRMDHVCSAGVDQSSIRLVDTSVSQVARPETSHEVLPVSCTPLTCMPRAQGDGLVDAVTLSAGGGCTRVHTTQVTVVQSPERSPWVPEMQLLDSKLLGSEDEDVAPRANMPLLSPLSSPLSCRSALSEAGARALVRSRDASRRSSFREASDSAAQAASALGLSTAGEPGGAAVGASDGHHCARCEEMTLVASEFGGLCYYCHSFPRAETWRQLRARFALIAALCVALTSSSDPPPKVSSTFDLPGLEYQV